MYKILLIEDRVERQQLFSDETGFNFEKYKSILDNRNSLDGIELGQYNTIVCHRSAFGASKRLKDHCAKKQVQLIFFSGGISSTFYSHIKYEFLLLNSKAFYHDNLKLYLDEVVFSNNSNLLLLAYGNNWKINLMLNTLSRVNMFIAQNLAKEKVKVQRLKTYSQFENLKDIVDIEYPVAEFGGAIGLKDVKVFASKLNGVINKEILMNA